MRVAPQVDPGEGLPEDPVAVGLDPVVGPVRAGRGCRAGWTSAVRVRWRGWGRRPGCGPCRGAGCWCRRRGTVGGCEQPDRLAEPVGQLVGVRGCLVGEVDDRLDHVVVQRAQVLVHEPVRDQDPPPPNAPPQRSPVREVLGGEVQVRVSDGNSLDQSNTNSATASSGGRSVSPVIGRSPARRGGALALGGAWSSGGWCS